MAEISSIDAIIDLIMREARARKGHSLKTRVYNVKNEVDRRIGLIMEDFEQQESKEKWKERRAEWSKGM